ncbi:hypothetical protein CALCODRAFT_508067 [Calocera cornea HHB12733]|uniref:Uncharacterized protein n=1 Tax=Calocera cornea HHB12733 TaxID=1353952 RepID=A0A165GXH8_9BASI|nr:hypothetical protein CALCODRAFT_508067 [Calocera cornea HHB12733]
MSHRSADTESQQLLDGVSSAMSQLTFNDDSSQEVVRMRRLPAEGGHTPSHSLPTSPEALAFLPASERPGPGDRTTSQQTGNDSGSSQEHDVKPTPSTPPRRPRLANNWWSSVSQGFEREGSKINGVMSIRIPFTNQFLRFKIFRWWFSFDGLTMVGIIILYTILALFAWNSTRADHTNAFVLPSTDSIFIITTLSTAGTTLIGMLVGSALESVRWRKAVTGVHAATFLGLSSATGVQGKLSLLQSRSVAWSTKVWVLIVFAFAGVNYLLSNILTVGLQSAVIFEVTYWDFNTMSGIGPCIPYDMTAILYPTQTNMSVRIGFSYDSFTSDPTQVFPITANLSQLPGSHNVPTPLRTLCDDGCFAYLLPGTVAQVVTSGPQPPPGHAYCNQANLEECVTPPYVFDADGLPNLLACNPSNDPTDTLCVANAVLDDRKSPNRSTYSTLNTNLTAWEKFNISDTLRTQGPAAMLYFEPFTFDGFAAASNMTACQGFTATPYAINVCYKEIDDSSIAIGWATCGPAFQTCSLNDSSWSESLTSSTIMSLEQRYVGAVHSLPTGSINSIEDFESPAPLTLNSTAFFTVVANVFSQGTAITNLIYNIATSPDLARFGADLRMRDLLTCTYALGASQIQVDAPLGAAVPWNNAGQAGINIARDRVILSLTSIIIFAVFAALTLIVCALMFAYASSGITPNNSDFGEIDIATRASRLQLFDGLSNADNKEVVEKIAKEYVWIGESDDGRSVEMSTERLAPLQLRKSYV